jgi:hypothetical protein
VPATAQARPALPWADHAEGFGKLAEGVTMLLMPESEGSKTLRIHSAEEAARSQHPDIIVQIRGRDRNILAMAALECGSLPLRTKCASERWALHDFP